MRGPTLLDSPGVIHRSVLQNLKSLLEFLYQWFTLVIIEQLVRYYDGLRNLTGIYALGGENRKNCGRYEGFQFALSAQSD